ncbi:homocysteine S-methyltransferase family protein [Massilia sp. Mn16-1_5]|uniref:homocysteine S-methyltransferase family protein n=1 Tax=Massilia sp. Mn16-1_5 TaxID=2079199 RepID=UPI00109E7456|nr:homocysteine S-methyltransferase family protein [Massilia sp. Mn16-1_5]THC42251.1 homocysteine S-methyltransferase [Massilia sp. Mn16-1_5]
MSPYRTRLPQLDGRLFLTDAGLETMLSFQQGFSLPAFASFVLLQDARGRAALQEYFVSFARLARAHGTGLVLETPTWRANPDWGQSLGYNALALADADREAVALLAGVRAAWETPATPIVISGNIGPRGDGYRADRRMSAVAAHDYHLAQIATFAGTEADMVAAFTITYPEEAIGIVDAAAACEMPVAISFTLETDGRLPSGDALSEAILRTDAETGAYAAYYMINCAHPTHVEPALAEIGPWRERLHGLRANASRRSHAELDEATELDDGDPEALGEEYQVLHQLLPRMNVLGGCCGTDTRHVAAIARHVTGKPARDGP